jgi:hypothetical protein
VVGLHDLVRPEELDDLAPLRRGAPGAVVKPGLDGPAALWALAHPSLLSNGGYYEDLAQNSLCRRRTLLAPASALVTQSRQ